MRETIACRITRDHLPVDPQLPGCCGLLCRQRQRETQGTIPPDTHGARASLSPKPKELYTNACEGAHIPDNGATGARTYPSLAGDKALEAVDIRGRRGPARNAVGIMMSDEHVTAVVNYVRAHFGNHCRNAVTADRLKAVRSADTWYAVGRRRP